MNTSPRSCIGFDNDSQAMTHNRHGMYFETPNSSRLPAIRQTRPTVAKVRQDQSNIMTDVMRIPYSSRIRSLRPLPVTAPMRADIS